MPSVLSPNLLFLTCYEVVVNARWYAGYDLRVNTQTKEKPVKLIYQATVIQDTGEVRFWVKSSRQKFLQHPLRTGLTFRFYWRPTHRLTVSLCPPYKLKHSGSKKMIKKNQRRANPH